MFYKKIEKLTPGYCILNFLHFFNYLSSKYNRFFIIHNKKLQIIIID